MGVRRKGGGRAPGVRRQRGTDLGYLQLIPLVRARNVISKRLRANELMVRARRRDDIAVPGDLPREAGDGAGHYITADELRRPWEGRWLWRVALLTPP